MPWNDETQAGFTGGTPWLPIPATHRARSVAVQDADPDSVLNAVRAFLHWRKDQPALTAGSIRFLDAPEPVLAFIREHEGQSLLVAFNLSGSALDWSLPSDLRAHAVDAPGVHNGRIDGGRLHLPAHGASYATLS